MKTLRMYLLLLIALVAIPASAYAQLLPSDTLDFDDPRLDDSTFVVEFPELEDSGLVFRGLGGAVIKLDTVLIPPMYYNTIIATNDSNAVIGYNIYRREEGLSWQKINAEPIRMADKEQFKKEFGEDIFNGLIADSLFAKVNDLSAQSVTFSQMSDEDKAWTFLSNNTSLTELGLLAVMSEYYPALGLAFVDTTVMEGINYDYKVAAVTLKGEIEEREAGSIIYSAIPQVKTPVLVITGQYKKEMGEELPGIIDGKVYYVGNPNIRYMSIYRISNGGEPKLMGRFLAPFKGRLARQVLPFQDTLSESGELLRYRVYGADEWWNYTEPAESEDILAFDIWEDYYVSSATITSVGDVGLEVSWEDDTLKPVYKSMIVYRSNLEEGQYQAMDTLPYTARRWLDTNVRMEETWFYKLQRIYINGDTGSYSPFFTGHFEVLVPPPAPENIELTATKEGITVTWEPPNSKQDLLGYYLMRATKEDGPYFTIEHLDSSARSFTDTKKYYPYLPVYYRIAAINLSRVVGDSSLPISILPYLDTLELKPKAIWNAYVDDDNFVTVQLSDYKGVYDYIEGYNIYRYKGDDDSNPEKLNTQVLREPLYQDKTAAIGEKYRYRYTLVDKRGFESSISSTKQLVVEKIERMIPPVDDLRIRYEDEGIRLTWTGIPDSQFKSERTQYLVLRSDDGYSFETVGTTQELTFFDALPKGMMAYYKVVALYDEEEGRPSLQVTAIR